MKDIQTESEIESRNYEQVQRKPIDLLKYLAAGAFFGVVAIKSEIISWYRIQEMFRFQSFHMYGVIGSAVATGALSILILKKLKAKTLSGEDIVYPTKKFHKGQIIGGLLFGIGWAFTGACPGPLYAHLATGDLWAIMAIFFAFVGTWTYGMLFHKLPR